MSTNFGAKYNVSFSGQRLLPLAVNVFNSKLPKVSGADTSKAVKEKCFFTELGDEDISVMKDLESRFFFYNCASNVISSFLHCRPLFGKLYDNFEKKYFILETPSEKDLSQKIKGLVELTVNKDSIKVDFIESAGSFSKDKTVVGSGSAMLYGVCRLAEKLKRDCITLCSYPEAMEWYKKLGFKQDCAHGFRLEKSDFPQFKKNIENRLSIECPEFCKEGENASSI